MAVFFKVYPQLGAKKIDLKGKILQGLSSEKIYAFSAKIKFASTASTKFRSFPLAYEFFPTVTFRLILG